MEKNTIKEALRAEKAMNQALKDEKSSERQRKQPTTPKVSVVAEKI